MDIFQQRWPVRILGQVHQLNGARFVVLKHQLGVNADSLTRSLEQLMRLGLVQRNPGYGHPLRPEYILTKSGNMVAPLCTQFEQLAQSLSVVDTVYRKWSVPVLVSLAHQSRSFSGLREELSVTPRALTQGLRRLVDADLATRANGYSVTSNGNAVAVAAVDIARHLPR